MSSILIGSIEEGLIYGIMVLGVYITYRLLDFPDLSVDGTFPLGVAVTAYCLTNGINPYLALLMSAGAGAIAGLVTGILHVHLKITNLLSGIIVMTGVYSINLRVMGNKSNVALFNEKTIFTDTTSLILVILVIVLVTKLLLDWYLSSKSGFILRATGDNPQIVTTLGVDVGKAKILGVMLSNGLVALSGSVLAQKQNYADIQMGVGIIVIGLASIIIGESLFSKISFTKVTTNIILGAIVYRIIIGMALRFKFEPGDLKLITAIMVIIFLGINNRGKDIKKFFLKKSETKNRDRSPSSKGGRE